MPLFSMPIILRIEAASLQDAQEQIDSWHEDLDTDCLPEGTDSVEHSPSVEKIDDQRVIYLPLEEDEDDGDGEEEDYDVDDDDDDADDDDDVDDYLS